MAIFIRTLAEAFERMPAITITTLIQFIARIGNA